MKDYFIESCVVSLDQAVGAFQRGADRLEVCTRLETEGMTPEINVVAKILNNVSIPVRVMIREIESGFGADEIVLEKMISAIENFKGLPIDGLVIGLLQQGRIDREKIQKLINSALPFSVTIHKAIDLSSDPESDVKWLNQ
ncbi:MAG TPA: copper homeostasis protein CutC, partial [Saprospiraceae bacterium]|nr:copper homeostasis protein CutC [Saprospiraceae bacterium]